MLPVGTKPFNTILIHGAGCGSSRAFCCFQTPLHTARLELYGARREGNSPGLVLALQIWLYL